MGEKRGRPAKWPWRETAVGESFEMLGVAMRSAASIVSTTNRRMAPLRFRVRQDDDGVVIVERVQ